MKAFLLLKIGNKILIIFSFSYGNYYTNDDGLKYNDGKWLKIMARIKITVGHSLLLISL